MTKKLFKFILYVDIGNVSWLFTYNKDQWEDVSVSVYGCRLCWDTWIPVS